jgi:hypothetical protein
MTRRLALLALLALVVAARDADAGDRGRLPPRALRGNEFRLQEYPAVSLATPAQRAAAERLLSGVRAAAEAGHWGDPRRAEADGFDTRTAHRRRGDLAVHYLHAERRRNRRDHRYLDPRQPKALIYANLPGRPLILVGAMFSMPRGLHGPTPGGPITRWHTHTVCADGGHRGLAPRADGSCPPGAAAREGSEMMHVWFTNDLRSAFAIHGPTLELGLAAPRGLVCHLQERRR